VTGEEAAARVEHDLDVELDAWQRHLLARLLDERYPPGRSALTDQAEE
jgi:hypothetical protein